MGRSPAAVLSTSWRCSIAPNPPGALLLVECRGPASPEEVEVLLDGIPAADHPTVYVASDVPDEMTPGTELEFLFVLTGGAPQFEQVEIRWIDALGRPQTHACEAVRLAAAMSEDDVWAGGEA